MTAPTYSFVIPVHNEAETLPALKHRLVAVMDRLDGPSEVIFVDDGSRDASYELMTCMHLEDQRFKVVHLSRNFGHQIAITAGMDLAAGAAVVIMDADLQDPPEVVLEMAERWRGGYDVVFGVRDDRSTDTWFKRTTAAWFYKGLGCLTEVDIPAEVGDFRLVDRRAIEAIKAMREGSRFVRGMFAWLGFRTVGVPYKRDVRYAGETKYPLRKMLKFASDGVVGFSRVPLRMALNLGFFVSALAVLGGIGAVGLKVEGGFSVPGWTSIVLVVLMLGGLQLALMGVLGEYVGRIYQESLARPLYVVRDLQGIAVPFERVERAVINRPSKNDVIILDAATPGPATLAIQA